MDEFIGFLVKGDRQNCIEYIQRIIEEDPNVINIYEGILKKSLYEIGTMWANKKISVETEQLATSTVESLLNFIYESAKPVNSSGKKVLVASTEFEIHRVGI